MYILCYSLKCSISQHNKRSRARTTRLNTYTRQARTYQQPDQQLRLKEQRIVSVCVCPDTIGWLLSIITHHIHTHYTNIAQSANNTNNAQSQSAVTQHTPGHQHKKMLLIYYNSGDKMFLELNEILLDLPVWCNRQPPCHHHIRLWFSFNTTGLRINSTNFVGSTLRPQGTSIFFELCRFCRYTILRKLFDAILRTFPFNSKNFSIQF